MGCCASTQNPSSPYPSPPNNVNSSSRAIYSSQPASQAMLATRPSTNASNRSAAPTQHARDLTKHPTKNLKLHVWTSQTRTWTRAQIDEERTAFFDTRTSGRPEIWQAIRAALEVLWNGDEESDGGLATAQMILTAAGVTIPQGDMTGAVYDSFGALYPLPPYIVSDPTNVVELPSRSQSDEGKREEGIGIPDEDQLQKNREDKGKGVVNPEDLIDIKVKLSNRGDQPVVISISKEDSIRLVTKKIFEDSGLEPPQCLRLAYMGKILKENQTLIAQGWKDDHVLNGLVLG